MMSNQQWIEQVLLVEPVGEPPRRADVLIEGDRIAAIEPRLDPSLTNAATRTDGRGKLLIPGLINAHHHSHDRLDKGRFSGLPLEIWLSLYNPPGSNRSWTPREVYLRTVLNGVEMLRGGITTVVDDIHFGAVLDPQVIEAALQAYADLGIRAEVSAAWSDKPFFDGVPHLRECLPERLRRSSDALPATLKTVEDCWRALAKAWDGRVRFVFSPSAPQRCTLQFLEITWDLARSFQRPVLIHLLETRIQALTARREYKMPMAKYMHQHGLLTSNTLLAHGVWLTEEELELIAQSGASVVHNPACNLKQGSGLAPVSAMIRQGVNVALGTDNNNGNDLNSMFDAMRLATFAGAVGRIEAKYPIDAARALLMATLGGAKALGRHAEIGAIEIGKQADFALLDLSTPAFTPLNEATTQLVFCEQGQSVRDVFVGGRKVVDEGRITQLDERALMEEITQRMPSMMSRIEDSKDQGARLRPYLEQAYQRCLEDPAMTSLLQTHNALGAGV